MNARDKDTKSFQDKLKQYFKKSSAAGPSPKNELTVTVELERELGIDTPLPRRLKALRDLTDKVLNHRLQSGAVEKLWVATKDLLSIDQSAEVRHVELNFLRCLAEGQLEQLVIMRTILFRYLRESHPTHPPEDSQLRFRLLHTLTNGGKNITCFEDEFGQFILEWIPQIQSEYLVDFLSLVINLIKFNAAHLDEEIVSGIVNNCCYLCCYSPEVVVVQQCMGVLEAVVSYSLFPHDMLHTFVCALCRTVNVEHYCQSSWKIMRYVLGSDLGHAALQQLVEVLCGGATGDAGLTRGAVFYTNMALWGARRVPSLRVSYLSVLPAFLTALERGQTEGQPQQVVTYEVLLAVQSLITKFGQELHEPAWDIVFEILHTIIDQTERISPPNELIASHVHEVITTVEAMYERRQYHGAPEDLYRLVDRQGHKRPEPSVLRLITYRASDLRPARHGWLAAAARLADKYCRQEVRLPVRLHTLQALHTLIQQYRATYEEELLERVGIPCLQQCAADAEPGMRAAAAAVLAELAAHCSSDATTDLLDLLEKIMNRPFDMYVTEFSLPADADITDIRAAVDALLHLLHAKLYRLPSSHAVRVYFILVGHLELHYRRPAIFRYHFDIRLKILEVLLSARANAQRHVGFCYDARRTPAVGMAALRLRPVCSPYISVDAPPGPSGAASAPAAIMHQGITYVSVRRACQLVVACLTVEREWTVLEAVLRLLPLVLQCRPLVLAGGRRADLGPLPAALCAMVADRLLNLPDALRLPTGFRLSLSDFHGTVLPVLASLAPYHHHLDSQTQQKMIKCLLKYGIVLRTPQQCITALTIFTLEMRETMAKMLPEVLLDLSKISDTKHIACPMLEFLSTLTRLPKVYASFVEDQYMSVFAILLPYTNPSRYNHYVVSLAHHVIAAWFLKCRLSYRRNFVKFIIHGLHNYSIVPFEEQMLAGGGLAAANEDSSNRKRSSSLGSKGVSRAPLSASAAFHLELTETCVDLLARYTFSPCSVKPHRSPTAEFLFSGGQSVTWLVGHKLVTVTTSGCLQNSLKQGLCDRCLVLCKRHLDAPAPVPIPHSPEPDDDEPSRYAKRSLQHSRSTDTSCSSFSASDTSLLPPSSGLSTRQNSSETKSGNGPNDEAHAQLTLKLENLAVGEDRDESARWSRVPQLLGGGCPCWCSNWAEVHVRSPTGDVSWVMRMQNQMNFDGLLESPLHDVAGLLAPSLGAQTGSSSTSSGIGDSRHEMVADGEPRSRSGSSSSQHRAASAAPAPHSVPIAPDLYKSSSDTVVTGERKTPQTLAPHRPLRIGIGSGAAGGGGGGGGGVRTTTEPINIPGSPQRQSSSSTTTDDDDTLIGAHEGRSRHPVRRSNSSPEMSSSWKAAFLQRDITDTEPPVGPEPVPTAVTAPAGRLNDCIVLPPTVDPTTTSLHHAKKGSKKSDMRSCEAIPEETGNTPPHHPHLMTYNSDPGTGGPAQPVTAVASDTALDALSHREAMAHGPLQKVASDGSVAADSEAPTGSVGDRTRSDRDQLPPLARSKRSNTISVMGPTPRRRDAASPKGQRLAGGGVTPAFVLLQLYHNLGAAAAALPAGAANRLNPWAERPLAVTGAQYERSIKNLDLVPPVETYKVGVLYVGPGQQDNEVSILKNEYGSLRYAEFLRELGTLVDLEAADAERPSLFLNLEKGGKDGSYTYVWMDDIMQVQFHVATAMPNLDRDPNCNEKRKYIGNDYVSIVYNDSGADFPIHTIKGQLNFCVVVVEPLELGINRVLVKTKDERIRTKFLSHIEPQVISDRNVALLARQMALHCALASLISRSLASGDAAAPYASNSLERLRVIKRMRARLVAEREAVADAAPYAPRPERARRLAIDDFTDYT
ncbi:Tuberin [Eumeta japonica]|uniref:Tuberin n=1 Tax=Eumeta variegata TaxID=151549 RepID=A0A4C1UWF0_EUMVA|nr:Tuberin [Eumeta japonica]